ncbi:hypothetical protein CYLTODRAFT_423857 [Cylindrobasidium torrendii FP15055 ss-10]|uniref:SMP-LTD domain-containing protein n=1 Tax=Cylindrobasidium torrendii FP15055 ss-10 TaxID=1314674 RepID=A0A0D7B648_9AGAR|nr:hypothetical protein CYLTODRAFT_423857 [Cylindrobasidium torrendii FP15055 ss-10]
MSLKAILYAYVLGGLTFIPLVLVGLILFTVYTSVPVGEVDGAKIRRGQLEDEPTTEGLPPSPTNAKNAGNDLNDLPRTRRGWMTMRRTFEESQFDGGYVTLVRSFLDARSKDPKRSRPKDMWYVVLKGTILYLYEDEAMTECEAAIQLGAHDVVIYPEDLPDAELFAKRNAVCLKPKTLFGGMPSVSKEMKLETDTENVDADVVKDAKSARDEAHDSSTPWFMFVRSNVEMEDWYLALKHASTQPAQTPMLQPLQPVFDPDDMNNLVSTLDEQPDVIPMRWLNALIGRLFYSFYKTARLENGIIGRLMKKLTKVKTPAFITELAVTQVSVGNTTPTFSKPMLKELTKAGDASMEVHVAYKGEVRITVEAMVKIDIGSFRSYNVKLVLAVVLREIEGNLLIKVKRPPSNRIWYAFTAMPRMVLEVEPIVSDRQLTLTMILSTIESKLKEIIQESIVLPNMDDISFYESIQQDHRGGIWADSARRERQPDHLSEPLDEEAGPSSPPTGPADTLSESEIPLPPPLDKTLSLPEDTATTKSLPQPPSMDASTASAPAGSGADSKSRRRTWFSTVRGDEFKTMTEDMEQERGRSVEIEKPDTNQRSLSTPSKSESQPLDDTPVLAEPAAPDSQAEQVGPSRSSSHSSGRVSTPEPTSPTPRTARSGSISNISPTTTFLSTLKAKAGDKQALSNSAKEAMRKWGWGVKKDSEDSGMSDQGSVSSASSARTRIDSIGHRARTSYAEVRAAVENRRGNETPDSLAPPMQSGLSRTRTTSTGSHSSSTSQPDPEETPPTLAVPTPIRSQPQARTMSIPGIHKSHRGDVMSMGYVAPEPPAPTMSPPRNPMYRLWKTSGPSPPSLASQDGSTNDSGDEAADTATHSDNLSDTVQPLAIPKRGPAPPLPPRKVSVSKPHTRVVSEAGQSASDSLKNIVKRQSIGRDEDVTKRVDGEEAPSQQGSTGVGALNSVAR